MAQTPEQRKIWSEKNPGKWSEYAKTYRTRHYVKHWLRRIELRCIKKSIPFDLDIFDLEIPKFCPVLGYPLVRGDSNKYNSPSVDRLYPELGYIKGNIRIISYRANQVKSNSTIEEIEKVLDYMKREMNA